MLTSQILQGVGVLTNQILSTNIGTYTNCPFPPIPWGLASLLFFTMHLTDFIFLEFDLAPPGGFWWAFGPPIWAFGPPIWAIGPSKHPLDINGCHDMTMFYLCAKFQLSSMIRSASRTPRPRSHTWKTQKVPDWRLGWCGHSWHHGSS